MKKGNYAKGNYVIVNIWTADTNKALGGHSCGHVSIETSKKYYSLWPAMPRMFEQIVGKINQKVANGLKPGEFFSRRPDFKTSYMHDAVTEGYCKNRGTLIKSIDDLKAGEVALIKNDVTGTFKLANSDMDMTHPDDKLYSVQPLYSKVRLVLFDLDKRAIKDKFNELDICGWRKIGSNIFTRALNEQTNESCASLAMRLLTAGGMYKAFSELEGSYVGSQTSSIVKPEYILKHLMKAKRYEIQENGETAKWLVPGVEQTSLDALERAYSDVRMLDTDLFKDSDDSCVIL